LHDLRHEAASRLHEKGWPLHHVKDMLSHATLDQTTTYLNVKIGGLKESMQKIDMVRSGCNPVVISSTIEQPLTHNGKDEKAEQVTVN
jgi:Phage integrase family